MSTFLTAFRYELKAFFAVPLGYLYLAVFTFLSVFLAFTVGEFFTLDDSGLSASFFTWHPLVHALLAPALGMRSWSQEKSQGTLELLRAQPIDLRALLLGKYIAAVAIVLTALLLTFPLVVTVFSLGTPDLGELLCGYLGSLLLATAFLALATWLSALLDSPVTVYLSATAVCLSFVLMGSPQFAGELLNVFPGSKVLVDGLASLGVMAPFDQFRQGVITGFGLIYFGTLILGGLLLTHFALKITLD